jgi:hypothetical protein
VEYKEYVLPESVNEYIKEQLSWDKNLSKTILAAKDVTHGKKISLLPVNYDLNSIENYNYGHILDREDSIAWMVNIMDKFLEEDTNHIILLLHPLASPTDSSLKKEDLPIVKYVDDVYVYLYSGNFREQDMVKKCLIFADCFYLAGIMSTIEMDCSELPVIFNSDILTELVKNAKYLIVSAFDVEGYILCEL